MLRDAMPAAEHHAEFIVAPTHPVLPGHFPGSPVVPGVVVLDEVRAIAARWLGEPLVLAGLPQVKFSAPLLPGRTAQVRLQREGARLRFAVSDTAGMPLASGVLALAEPSP
jgi:3-hydroxymyristoyl/3-hydroxydecanoyl-(acyl carrier protein) dehydratase